MVKNEIEKEIKPFNDFLFKSCYYHQMIAAFSCFGIEAENILANRFVFIREKFSFEDKFFLTDSELAERLGCRIRNCIMSKRTLINNIDKGNPIIMGVDCYYLESRPEIYRVLHLAHFIMVYGYDTENNLAFVIDHDYANGLLYKKKAISLSNLLYANLMFEKGCIKEKKNTSRIISKKDGCGFAARINIREFITPEMLNRSRAASRKNTAELKKTFAANREMTADFINTVTNYLQAIKDFYCVFTKHRIFKQEDKADIPIKLVTAYTQILSAFRRIHSKNEFSFSSEQAEKLAAKADEIDGLENIIYERLKADGNE